MFNFTKTFFRKQYQSIQPHIKPAIVAAVGIEVTKRGCEETQKFFAKPKPQQALEQQSTNIYKK